MGADKVEYIFQNGEFVRYSDAKIHVMSPAVRYGALVFEGIRGYWNEDKQQLYLFKLREHLKRLQTSMKLMRFEESIDIADLERWTLALVRKNKMKQGLHIRPQVYLDGEVGGVGSRKPIGVAIIAQPMGNFLNEDGIVNAMVSSWRRLDDDVMPTRIKCAANYQNARLALIEASMHGYDTTIMLNKNGKVAEEARACLFIIRDGVPITPPVTAGILESITRKTVLQLCSSELGMNPVERDIDRTELYIADEAFFCGSGAEITPIKSIDGIPLKEMKITSEIKKCYLDIVNGANEKYDHWVTGVY